MPPRIRLGVIGGGGAALIGPVHRMAARLDDRFEIVAGVLSSDGDKSVAEAERLGIPRGYRTVPEMIAGEAGRVDGIEATAIMTPNDSHARFAAMALDAGLDVICDKPLTNDFESARALADKAAARGLVLSLTHNYSGYPMIREARAAVMAGELGQLRFVHVAYVQGSLGSLVESRPEEMPSRLRWRLDPAIGGASHVLGDIGTHAHQLLTYIAGQPVASVLADVGAAVPGRTRADDTAAVIVRMADGARGALLATKAATGAENAMSIEVYGEAGGLSWQQSSANELRVMHKDGPAELRTRGLKTLHPLSLRGTRLPPGHPEAFIEAFANVYLDFADLVSARRAGVAPDPLALHGPDALTGVQGLAFVEACLASSRSGGWADVRQV